MLRALVDVALFNVLPARRYVRWAMQQDETRTLENVLRW